MKKSNLLSRKFLLTLLTAASGIATALTGVGGKVGTIAGLSTTILATVTYVVMEGKIDRAAVSTTVKTIEEIVEVIKKGD